MSIAMRAFLASGFMFSLAFAVLPAKASSPGMIEGPPGCAWTATVTTLDPAVQVRLDKMIGTCMYEPGPCGKEGDVIPLPTENLSILLAQGQTLDVWVDTDAGGGLRANVSIPACARTPVNP